MAGGAFLRMSSMRYPFTQPFEAGKSHLGNPKNLLRGSTRIIHGIARPGLVFSFSPAAGALASPCKR
jgi:hypothetical protein